MRVSKEKAAENRERILTAASRLIRERGISGVGVDTLTEAAGLTHGSLYSQFGSKQRLAEEALSYALAGSVAEMGDVDDLTAYFERYLSPKHRDTPGRGCALAALGCEMPRQETGIRERFTGGVRRMVEQIGSLIRSGSKRQREDEALAVVAAMVGALVLARAVDDNSLSDRILLAVRKRFADKTD